MEEYDGGEMCGVRLWRWINLMVGGCEGEEMRRWKGVTGEECDGRGL